MIRPPTVHKPRLRFYFRVTGLYFEQRKVEREMHEKMMEKMKAMEEKMRIMQESGALEAQKHEMKQMFIDNLMKNQDVSQMFKTDPQPTY